MEAGRVVYLQRCVHSKLVNGTYLQLICFGIVHLNNERLQFMVNQNIKAEDFKTSTANVMMGEASSVVMFESGLCRQYSFYYNVVDFLLQSFHIIATLSQPIHYVG